MRPQTKLFILIGCLLVIYLVGFGAGIVNHSGDRPETTEKEARTQSNQYQWPGSISGVIGGLSPAIAVSNISYIPSVRQFGVASDTKTDFRSLKLKVRPGTDNPVGWARASVVYTDPGAGIDALKQQAGTLVYPSEPELTLTVLKTGGRLSISPENGSEIVMIVDDKDVWLWRKNRNGHESINTTLTR